MSQTFHPAIPVADIAPSAAIAVEIAGRSILVCLADGEFHAMDNVCPHQNSPLAGGRIRRGTLACPLHGLRFDLRTGKPQGELTRDCLRLHATRVTDGVLEIALD